MDDTQRRVTSAKPRQPLRHKRVQSCCGLIRNDQEAVVLWSIIAIVISFGSSLWQRTSSSNASQTIAHVDSQIELNSATAAEFDLLEGIGPKLSARILEDRDSRGPFKSVDSLQRVKGIGPKTIEKNRPHLRVATAD